MSIKRRNRKITSKSNTLNLIKLKIRLKNGMVQAVTALIRLPGGRAKKKKRYTTQ